MDWDVSVSVIAQGGEKVSRVLLKINGSPTATEDISPPENEWEKTYTQVGQFPGENKVQVTATSDSGEETIVSKSWQ